MSYLKISILIDTEGIIFIYTGFGLSESCKMSFTSTYDNF